MNINLAEYRSQVEFARDAIAFYRLPDFHFWNPPGRSTDRVISPIFLAVPLYDAREKSKVMTLEEIEEQAEMCDLPNDEIEACKTALLNTPIIPLAS